MSEEVKILVICPYEGLVPLVKNVAAEFPSVQLTATVGNLNDGLAYAVKSYSEKYDYIISRGGTAKYIRNAVSVPVIEIETRVSDILTAMNYALSTSSRLAIVGFQSITQSIESLENLLPYDYKVYGIDDVGDLDRTFQEIRDEGIRSVLCDTISYEAARSNGFNAFLITSGEDSIREALKKALFYHESSVKLREENRFLRELISLNSESATVVYSPDFKLYYASLTQNDTTIFDYLYELLPRFALDDTFKLVKRHNGSFFHITARKISVFDKNYYVFFISRRVPATAGEKRGIHYYDNDEVADEIKNSVFGISNVESYYSAEIEQCISRNDPVLISGEVGAGKDHIAKVIYLRSQFAKNPFVVIDCSRVNSKTWNYLIMKPESPICDSGNTIFIKNIDALNLEKLDQLLLAITQGDAVKRNHILISRSEQRSLSVLSEQLVLKAIDKFKCLIISLSPLRGATDVIENAVRLLLNNFNVRYEHAPVFIQPEALALLVNFSWPQNYEQLMRVMEKLAFLVSDGAITAQHVNDALRVELSFVQGETPSTANTIINLSQNLESINRDIVKVILDQNNGNQSIAARNLGISRTTLWRMLKD